MQMIILSDSELKLLEERLGPAVRLMGPWSSDGIFGYTSVPLCIVEFVAKTLNDPFVWDAVSRLKTSHDRTKVFVELMRASGPTLLDGIVSAYRESLFDGLPASHETNQGVVVDWQAA